jgi:CRP-like cAMP-binding protein
LAPPELALLTPYLTLVDLPQGMVIAEVEDPVSFVYFPEDGMVSFVVVTQAGQSVEASAIGREGIVGVEALRGTGRSLVHSMVQVPGRAWRMDAARFQALLRESPALVRIADLHMEVMVGQALQSIACMAFHTVEERMARWLLTAREQIGRDTIQLTQEFLAQMLGVQRTTVTLVAHTLQAAGLITYRRGRVEIVDVAALEEAACECYRQTRQRFDLIFPQAG